MESNKPKIIGSQSWQRLLFLHWRMPTEQIQAVLPAGLEVETFDGDAWLAVVPFSMEKVRPWWSPPVPGISWFLETNVRTYVRHANGQTGVWFLSLDANHRLAVNIACRFWHLNYRFAKMSLQEEANEVAYEGNCRHVDAGYRLRIRTPSDAGLQTAVEGSLDHFLLERYHLFARHPSGRFLVGQVHHPPYQYQPVEILECQQTLTASHQLPIPDGRMPDHVVFSPGVDVRVSPLG